MKITRGSIEIKPVGSLNCMAIRISIGNEDQLLAVSKVLSEDEYDSVTVATALHALAEALFDS